MKTTHTFLISLVIVCTFLSNDQSFAASADCNYKVSTVEIKRKTIRRSGKRELRVFSDEDFMRTLSIITAACKEGSYNTVRWLNESEFNMSRYPRDFHYRCEQVEVTKRRRCRREVAKATCENLANCEVRALVPYESTSFDRESVRTIMKTRGCFEKQMKPLGCELAHEHEEKLLNLHPGNTETLKLLLELLKERGCLEAEFGPR